VTGLGAVFIARTLALLWAGFWLFFFVVESWAWHTPPLLAVSWVGVGLCFVILAIVPWRWEVAGGLVFVVLGLLIGVAYSIWPPQLPLASRMITTVLLTGPPIVAGILFLMHHRAASARTQ
jgi:hypothetical protein